MMADWRPCSSMGMIAICFTGGGWSHPAAYMGLNPGQGQLARKFDIGCLNNPYTKFTRVCV